MYNEAHKRDFFLLLIVSALLHLVVIIIFIVSRFNNSVKKHRDTLLTKKKEKTAQVVFQKSLPSKQKPLPQKPKPQKKSTPMFTSGNMASGSANTTPQITQPKAQQPVIQGLSKKQPVNKALEKKLNKQQKIQKKLKLTEKNKTNINELKKPAPVKPSFKKTPQLPEPKKLTLADLSKGFMNYARVRTPAPPSNSNHAVTVIGTRVGQATEEQLRYERYAAKLFQCIQASLTILLRKFRFVHKPNVQELALNFVMDVGARGDIAGLTIRQGTGNQQFDTFMINVLQHASKSFPPLPTYFRTTVCSFPIIYKIPIAAIQ